MRIRTLILETSRLKELQEFYSQDLQLPVTRILRDEIEISIGATQFILRKSNTADPFYHFAIKHSRQ